MDWRDAALVAAGIIGGGVAVVHGVLVQRLMVRPIEAAFEAGRPPAAAIRKLVPLLLHFSTVAWFLGGLVLIAAGLWFEPEARLVAALFVGAAFLFGALANLWATRGRHPGGMLMAAAVVLILLAVVAR